MKSVTQYKGLKKENLRDNMSTLELVLNMLAEATTTAISKKEQPETFKENLKIANEGGSIAGDTRRAIEQRTGQAIITNQNAARLNQVFVEMIEQAADIEQNQ